MGSNAEEDRHGSLQIEGDVEDHGRELTQQQRRRQSVAMTFARNCLALLALFLLLTLGTSSVSKGSAKTPEQVVKLTDTREDKETIVEPVVTYPKQEEASVYASESEESRQRRQNKGMRKRAHRKIKSPHPQLAMADSKRRLQMGMMGGMMGGSSRSSRSGTTRTGGSMFFSGRSTFRSFEFFPIRTFNPTPSPSASPSAAPIGTPSASPSARPSRSPSATPSKSPSVSPTLSKAPSRQPSATPSQQPSISFMPSLSIAPSQQPSLSAQPSNQPSASPSAAPTVSKAPSASPSRFPSASPSRTPSRSPSQSPTFVFRTFPPTIAPTEPRGTPFPTFDRRRTSRSRSGMGMMGMSRGRSFSSSVDQEEFDAELQDLIAFLPPDFLALFGNN